MAYCRVVLMLLLTAYFNCQFSSATLVGSRKAYIVHLDGQPFPVSVNQNPSLKTVSSQNAHIAANVRRNNNFLTRVDAPSSSKLYDYHYAMNGFSAALTEQQAAALQGMAGVKLVTPDKVRKVTTTYSPTFLGLNKPPTSKPPGLYTKHNGTGTIIAMIDTGIWPENLSFNDYGYPHPPTKFKGICQTGERWKKSNCNRKIIGARYFSEGYTAAETIGYGNEYMSARDFDGHGTHTASTAAGSQVSNASIGNFTMGQAQGVAFGAHISVYKVCWVDGSCYDSDILSGIEYAIYDQVDVISISLGSDGFFDPLEDSIFLGTLMATISGIPCVAAAGNSGPSPESVTNTAPWQFTVAASYLPRSPIASNLVYDTDADVAKKNIYLGDSSSIVGEAVTDGTLPRGKKNPKLPLIYAKNAALPGVKSDLARECQNGSLSTALVKGKIILCDESTDVDPIAQGYIALLAGANGMIIRNIFSNYVDDEYHVLPTIHLSESSGFKVLAYINKTRKPTVTISPLIVEFGERPAATARFSSRGPNPLRNIMKPNVVAPGVNIFAAYKPYSINNISDTPTEQFKFLMGTSMATPHVTGAVAILKALRPTWSIGALTSALSTTALPLSTGTANDFGSGLIRPNFADNPGLVYPTGAADYTLFLCTYFPANYVQQLIGETCPGNDTNEFEYNLPSLMMSVSEGSGFTATRRVRNVGPKNITYKVSVKQPSQAKVKVTPSTLTFNATNQVLTFKISIVGTSSTISDDYGISVQRRGSTLGSWTWVSTDKQYKVYSPIVVVVV